MRILVFIGLITATVGFLGCGGDGALDVRPAPSVAAVPTATPEGNDQ